MSKEDKPKREMTLEEYCAEVPDCHLINRELKTLKDEVERLNDEIKQHLESAIRVAEQTLKYMEEVKDGEG